MTKKSDVARAIREYPDHCDMEIAYFMGCTPSFVRATASEFDLKLASRKGRPELDFLKVHIGNR